MDQESISNLIKKKYVYNNIEVCMTGRTACRKSRRGEKIMFEVCSSGFSSTPEKFWVSYQELYEIKDNDKNEIS